MSTDPERLNAEGLAAFGARNRREARRCYRQAVALAPAIVSATANLGNLDAEENLLADACGRYRRALASAPGLAALHLMLGTALLRQAQDERGRSSLLKALELSPGHPQAHVNLAVHALKRLRPEEAERHFRAALRGDPNSGAALAGLARTLSELGRLEGVARLGRRALVLEPGARDSLQALAQAAFSIGRHGAARLWCARMGAADTSPEVLRSLMLYLHYDAGATSAEVFDAHRRWALSVPTAGIRRSRDEIPSPDRRLRIGYLSADLFEHPIGRNIVGLLENHDARNVEVFAYAQRWIEDAVSRRIRRAAHHWRDIATRTDRQLADLIRADGIDVLVVLAGHTLGNRIDVVPLAPAPVQVSMHDLTTSGLDAMDWFVGDEIVTPAAGEERFSERVARLPCFYLHMPIEEVPVPDARGGPLRLGSCSNPAKLGDAVIATWARVLSRLPDARLALKYRQAYADRTLVGDITNRFASHGVAADRLDFDDRRTGRSQHLAYVGNFDVALDTFPFNGSTTTYEALWMGVPVVGIEGRRFVGRVGASMLHHVGLSDLVAADEEAYVETAVRLAMAAERRRQLRGELRARLKRSPLLDAVGYARDVEALYRMMWRDRSAGGSAR